MTALVWKRGSPQSVTSPPWVPSHHRGGPGVANLVAVGVAGQFWGARGASGVKVGGHIVGLNLPSADQASGIAAVQQGFEGMGILPGLWGSHDLKDGFEAGNLLSQLESLFPDLASGNRPQSDERLAAGRIHDCSNGAQSQQGIDRVGDSRRLGAPDCEVGLGQVGEQDADRVAGPDSEFVQQIGRLVNAGDELPVGDRHCGSIVRPPGKKADRRLILASLGPLQDHLVGAACLNPFLQRPLFDAANVLERRNPQP